MYGGLQWLPKVLQHTSYVLFERTRWVCHVGKHIRLHKHLDCTLTLIIIDYDVRDFTNDMNNEIMYTDKVGFEALITHHATTFEIIVG